MGTEEGRKFLRRQRLAEKIALNFVACMAPQEDALLGGLDAFRNHRQSERLAHA